MHIEYYTNVYKWVHLPTKCIALIYLCLFILYIMLYSYQWHHFGFERMVKIFAKRHNQYHVIHEN